MKKYLIAVLAILFLSCEQEYITEKKCYDYKVIEREHHVELNPATEFFLDIKSTHVIYTLVLERNGNIITKKVDERDYYNHPVGSTYKNCSWVRVRNQNYKK